MYEKQRSYERHVNEYCGKTGPKIMECDNCPYKSARRGCFISHMINKHINAKPPRLGKRRKRGFLNLEDLEEDE